MHVFFTVIGSKREFKMEERGRVVINNTAKSEKAGRRVKTNYEHDKSDI